MSGIGLQELILLFIIGLLILGPERLPRVVTQIGRWVGKARRTANQLRYQIEREVALAELEEQHKSRPKPASRNDPPGSPAGGGENIAGDPAVGDATKPAANAAVSGDDAVRPTGGGHTASSHSDPGTSDSRTDNAADASAANSSPPAADVSPPKPGAV